VTTPFEYVLPAIEESQDAYIIITPIKVLLNLTSVFDGTGTAHDLRLYNQFEDVLSVNLKETLVKRAITHNDPVVVKIDSYPVFEPNTTGTTFQNQGRLRISMNSRFIPVRGIHTVNAIRSSILWENNFIDSTVLLKILTPNANTVPLSSFFDGASDELDYAIDHLLMSHPDKKHLIAEVVIKMVRPFTLLTDLEHSSLPTRSSKLFTFSSIKNATKALLMTCASNSIFKQAKIASNYWFVISKHIPEWESVLDRKISAGEIRQEYIHSCAPVLMGLGYLGAALFEFHSFEWQNCLERIANINWLRSNPEWNDRIIIDGKVSKAQSSIILMTSYLKSFLDIPLTSEEQYFENQLQLKRSSLN
jgi:DNA sulfur modification protein DndB